MSPQFSIAALRLFADGKARSSRESANLISSHKGARGQRCEEFGSGVGDSFAQDHRGEADSLIRVILKTWYWGLAKALCGAEAMGCLGGVPVHNGQAGCGERQLSNEVVTIAASWTYKSVCKVWVEL